MSPPFVVSSLSLLRACVLCLCLVSLLHSTAADYCDDSALVEANTNCTIIFPIVVHAIAPFIYAANSSTHLYITRNYTGLYSAKYTGISIDILQRIDEFLTEWGYTIEWRLYDNPNPGLVGVYDEEEDKYNGIIGELNAANALMAIGPLTLTQDRVKNNIASVGYFQVAKSVLVLKPSLKSNPYSFMQPFTSRLWWSLLGMSCFMGLAWWLVNWVSPYGWNKLSDENNERNVQLNLSTSFFLSTFNLVGGDFERPRSWSNKIIMLPYMFFILIMSSTYTANLAAYLTKQNATPALNSLDDLKNSKQDFCVQKSSSVHQWLEQNDQYADMLVNAVYENKFDLCVDRLRSGNVSAVVANTALADYVATQQPCDTLQVGAVFGKANFALPFHSNIKGTIVDDIDYVLLGMMENGEMDNIYKKWYLNKGSCNLIGDAPSQQQFDTSDVEGLFIVVFVGVAMGCGVLVIEMLVHKATKQQLHKVSPNAVGGQKSLSTRMCSAINAFMSGDELNQGDLRSSDGKDSVNKPMLHSTNNTQINHQIP